MKDALNNILVGGIAFLLICTFIFVGTYSSVSKMYETTLPGNNLIRDENPRLYEDVFVKYSASDRSDWVFNDSSNFSQDVQKGKINIALINDTFYKVKYLGQGTLKMTPLTNETEAINPNTTLHIIGWL